MQRRPFAYAHDHGHHHADDARHVIAIIERVIERLINTAVHVHLEALQELHGMAVRNAVLTGNAAERDEHRLIGVAFERALRLFAKRSSRSAGVSVLAVSLANPRI